jgi:hypothetical protein
MPKLYPDDAHGTCDPLTLAVECSPAAIALTTLAGELVCGNSAAETLLGAAEGGGRIPNLAKLCTEPAQIAMLEEVARDGKERQFSAYKYSADRGRRTLICRLRRIAGTNAIPTWLAFTALEYDEGASADGIPFDGVQSLQRVSGNQGIAAWMISFDDDGNWLNEPMEWSPPLFELLDVNPSVTRPRFTRFLEAIEPEDRTPLIERLLDVIRDRSSTEILYRVRPRNGPMKVIRGRVVFETDAGATRNRLWSVEEDITAMIALRPMLPVELAILESVTTNVAAPVYAVDADLRYIYSNELYRSTMRQLYDTTVLLGNRVLDGISPPGRRRVVLSSLRRALAGASAAEELTITDENSTSTRYDLTYAPIMSGPKTIGVLVLGQRLSDAGSRV